MASIVSFGSYLPDRVIGNPELARMFDCDPAWILESCGIEERRMAAPDETIAALAERAARDCLDRSILSASQIGLVILSSGTAERRFPGPAAQLAEKLGIPGVPAIDLPLASAGSLFAVALASQLAPYYGSVLVAAAEKMSAVGLAEPLDRNVGILFGDGAGACLIDKVSGGLEIVDSVLHSDGAYTDALHLEFSGPVQMDGRAVILQAARRMPAAIAEVLTRQAVDPQSVKAFLPHQANRNLLERVAKAIGVPASRFFCNIHKYGNTSSASLLIAAAEWHQQNALNTGDYICLTAFGAGFHWGAILIRRM